MAEESPKSPEKPKSYQERRWEKEDKEMTAVFDRFSLLLLKNKPREEGAEGRNLNIELEGFKKEFLAGFQTIRTVVENGGELEGITFEPNRLKAHDWEHMANDVKLLMKMLPGFLAEHQGQYSIQQVEALMWGMLLHDMGYLKTADDPPSSWQGEFFFDHVNRSVAMTDKLLDGLSSKGINLGSLKDSQNLRELTKAAIKMTDFNEDTGRLATDFAQRLAVGEDLLRLTWATDLLSYFTDPLDVPRNIQHLFYEHQARVRYDPQRPNHVADIALEKNLSQIMQAKGMTQEEVLEAYKASMLTIADLKFPGEGVYEFVSGEFPNKMHAQMTPYLKYLDYWYGGSDKNELRRNYEKNIERVKILEQIEAKENLKDYYCFLEGAFTGLDIQTWALKLIKLAQKGTLSIEGKNLEHLEWLISDPAYWSQVDQRIFGVQETAHPFDRLVTREIRTVLKLLPGQEREKALTQLLILFQEKHKGPGGCADYYMRMAPGAYKDLLDPEDIFAAFKSANQENPGRHLTFVWTIRREHHELDQELVDQLIGYRKAAEKEEQKFYVDLAGKETAEIKINAPNKKGESYKDLIRSLIENGLLITLQALQIYPDEKGEFNPEDLAVAQENLSAILDLVEEIKKGRGGETAPRLTEVFLSGLQHTGLITPPLRERVIEAALPLEVSISHDMSIFREEHFEKNPHPVTVFFGKTPIFFGSGDGAFLTSAMPVEILSGLLMVNPQADNLWLEEQVNTIFSKE